MPYSLGENRVEFEHEESSPRLQLSALSRFHINEEITMDRCSGTLKFSLFSLMNNTPFSLEMTDGKNIGAHISKGESADA